MAIVKNGLHVFRRDEDGIMIYLRMEDWPEDIPLPDGTRVVDERFWPNWNIVLNPDKTVERVSGWFLVPDLSLEETFRWYQVEMEKRGWVEEERVDTLPTWALLRYHQPETDVRVEISIRRNRYLNCTQPMIHRVTINSYAPPEAEETSDADAISLPVEEAAVEQEASNGESTVDGRGLGEGTEELIEKLAIAMSRLLGGDSIAGFPGAADLDEDSSIHPPWKVVS